MERRFDEAVEKYGEVFKPLTAREYFEIKRLAILYKMHIWEPTSYGISKIEMTAEATDCALDILEALYHIHENDLNAKNDQKE